MLHETDDMHQLINKACLTGMPHAADDLGWDAGGNVDDRRIGIGASMYYPVALEGGLVSMGDAHTAQGDSEFDGECRAVSQI